MHIVYRILKGSYNLLISECLAHLEGLEKPKGSAASMRQLYLKQHQCVSLLLKFIGGSVKIDESVLMRSLLCKIPYSFDKQYREFLVERENERQKDLQILSLWCMVYFSILTTQLNNANYEPSHREQR